MGRLEMGQGGVGSAYAALIVGGIAVALGGAALFGMVAHTWTPFLPQRGAGASPFDTVAVARGGSASPSTPAPASVPLYPRRSKSIPFDPRPDEFQAGELAPGESVVALAGPPPPVEAVAPRLVDPKPLDTKPVGPAPPPPLLAEIVRIEPPAVETRVAAALVEPRPAVIRVADVSVVGGSAKAPQEVRLVHSRPVDPNVAKARPVDTKRVESKVVAPKVAAPKVAPAKLAAQKVAEPKPAALKVAVAPRVEPKPVALKVAAVKSPEPPRAETKRAAEMKAAEARRAEAKRIADAKAVEARFAETKRAAEVRAAVAEAKLAEAKRAAEAKAMEWKLAEAKRAAEAKAAEEKLAESQRAFETKAAEARLAETKRAVESTLAEAKLAEARLAETKRAVEMTLAQAKTAEARPQPASQTRPTLPRYEWCDTCGTVSSVNFRSRDYGNRNWEVRVNFPDGNDRVFFFPTDPGLSSGERVRLEGGRLTRQHPRRAATYSPT